MKSPCIHNRGFTTLCDFIPEFIPLSIDGIFDYTKAITKPKVEIALGFLATTMKEEI